LIRLIKQDYPWLSRGEKNNLKILKHHFGGGLEQGNSGVKFSAKDRHRLEGTPEIIWKTKCNLRRLV
jgi:hypothetical protein